MRTVSRASSLAAAALFSFSAASALAHDIEAGALTLGHPHIRATLPGAPVAGGYMTITNNGDEPDRLIGGTASFSGAIEVHQMTMENDVMKMRELEEGLAIPAGETVTLEPGGLHLMFTDLAEELKEGERRNAILEFEKAGEIEVEFHVESRNPAKDAGHEAHGEAGAATDDAQDH